MSENAEAMLSGQDCAGGCGIVFERPHGHPVLCDECHPEWVEEVGTAGTYPLAYEPVHPAMREPGGEE